MFVMVKIAIIGLGIIILMLYIKPNTGNRVIIYLLRILKSIRNTIIKYFKFNQESSRESKGYDKELINKLKSELHNLQITTQESDATIQSLNSQINELSIKLNYIEDERENYKQLYVDNKKKFDKLTLDYNELVGKLYKVSTELVSDVFCKGFEQINLCIDSTERRFFKLIVKEITKQNYGFILQYFIDIQQRDIKELYGWYLTLKYASSVIGVAALDIEGCIDFKSQLTYLRRNAFLHYHRPRISSLILCLEKCRANSIVQQPWEECISQAINELSKLQINVNYIPIGSEFDSSTIDNILISESSRKDTRVGFIEDVITIGVNPLDLDVPNQKTEVIMNF